MQSTWIDDKAPKLTRADVGDLRLTFTSAQMTLIVSRSCIQIRIHLSQHERTFLDSRPFQICNYTLNYKCIYTYWLSHIYSIVPHMSFLHRFASFTRNHMFPGKSFWSSSQQSWWQRAPTTWQHPKRPSPSAHQTGFQSWHGGWSEGSKQMKKTTVTIVIETKHKKHWQNYRTFRLLGEEGTNKYINISLYLCWIATLGLCISIDDWTHSHELGATHLFVSVFIGCEHW